MTTYSHEAIRAVHPEAVMIDDSAGAFTEDGTKIELNIVAIAEKEKELDLEAAALAYQQKRLYEYPSIAEQLDMIYKDQVNGTTTFQEAIAAVKDKYPKGE